MEKQILLGNAAVARGLYEAGCRVVSSYPGTPSTEISEVVAEYPEVYAEWAPNEKVAVETALGAAVGGARAFSAMKHVGLNVAADPVFITSYTGISAGLVIGVADDPGMHSSQNEQDSRHYARAAKIPMLEPSDSQECKDFAKLAFDLSEKYDTSVFLRLSTRVSHSQSVVTIEPRVEHEIVEYQKNAPKYVMMPGYAKARHIVVEKRLEELTELAGNIGINKIIPGSNRLGVIAAGISYQYAREAFGDEASYLKLGMVWPINPELVKKFAASVDRVVVVEEGEAFIEGIVRALGIEVTGKDVLPYCGEYNPIMLRELIAGEKADADAPTAAPARPPLMCPGCPHRGIFYTLSKMKLTVSGDIGCYTLGATPPLQAIDTTYCMGASISSLHGMIKARGNDFAKKAVAVIGDSTFMHSGMTGLLNIVYNNTPATVIILDNSITGMTGHQENPATGKNLKGEPAPILDLETLVKALGVKRVRVCDPFDLKGSEAVIREELNAEEPSVVIARRPCALLKSFQRGPAFEISDKCVGCKLCMRCGCPAISFVNGKAKIDASLCVGCGLCAKLCPTGNIVEAK